MTGEPTTTSICLTNSDQNQFTGKQQKILDYLLCEIEHQTYFKSRNIAKAIGLSPKEIGANITKLRDHAAELNIEPWGYSSATTWKITEAT